MNAKHTPGPWEKDYGGTIGHIKSIAPHEHGSTPTVTRYDMAAQSIGPEEMEANARLIAAAPDLLAALEDVERVLIGSTKVTPESRDHLYQVARAAIAKATWATP